MQVIFLTYSNNSIDPLPTLREEDEKTYSLLARRSEQLHFLLHRDSQATVDSIIEFLELYRKEIIVFSFSGHAGRDKLFLDDKKASGQGIAGLLGSCPKLRLILLNGCSTAGQVKRLLVLPNQPIVIATHAPVGDYSAAKFGISFFRELSERGGTIEAAFQAGLNAAKMVASESIREVRNLALGAMELTDAAPWGIYAKEQTQLSWTFPTEPDSEWQRKETIAWIKWWGIYQLIGLGLLLATVLLQVSTASLWMSLIPLFFFFAPFLPTWRTRLDKKRLYILLSFHAVFYYFLLFFWMKDDVFFFFVYLLIGLGLYFVILPLTSSQKYY